MTGVVEMQRQAAIANGEEPAGKAQGHFGTPDELISTCLDLGSVYEAKRAAVLAPQNQIANFDFLQMDQGVAQGLVHPRDLRPATWSDQR